MKCPRCGHKDTRVIDSRPAEGQTVVRRRRVCAQCGFRFSTYERSEPPRVTVIKKDGRSEPFQLEKIRAGMEKALTHRPVEEQPGRLEQALSEIESEISGWGRSTVHSREIGEVVMRKLQEMDEVAYVRFASVHKEFEDARKFKDEVERLQQATRGRFPGRRS